MGESSSSEWGAGNFPAGSQVPREVFPKSCGKEAGFVCHGTEESRPVHRMLSGRCTERHTDGGYVPTPLHGLNIACFFSECVSTGSHYPG